MPVEQYHPPGSTADSLRSIKGLGGVTDEILREREGFNLRDFMANGTVQGVAIDLSQATPGELAALMKAAAMELSKRNVGRREELELDKAIAALKEGPAA